MAECSDIICDQLNTMVETGQTMVNLTLIDFLNCFECLPMSKLPKQSKQIIVKAIHAESSRITQARKATD